MDGCLIIQYLYWRKNRKRVETEVNIFSDVQESSEESCLITEVEENFSNHLYQNTRIKSVLISEKTKDEVIIYNPDFTKRQETKPEYGTFNTLSSSSSKVSLVNSTVTLLIVGSLMYVKDKYYQPNLSQKETFSKVISIDSNTNPLDMKIIGSLFGYICSILYTGALIPQILKNYKKRSCKGISVLFFTFSTLANLFFIFSIISESLDSIYLINNLPWLLGASEHKKVQISETDKIHLKNKSTDDFKSHSYYTEDTTEKLTNLRKLMKEYNVDAYLVPSEDENLSEYVSNTDRRRAFISGFTGSAGFAIVTLTDAALWTDGRYFLQATQQLDKNWTLMKTGLAGVPSREDWLSKVLSKHQNVAVDSKLISYHEAERLQNDLKRIGEINLIPLETNLVDLIWLKNGKPNKAHGPIVPLGLQFAGEDFHEKIARVRANNDVTGTFGIVLTGLDDIAWYEYIKSIYMIIMFKNEIILYAYKESITEETLLHLKDTVSIVDYSHIYQDFSENHKFSQKIFNVDVKLNWLLLLNIKKHNFHKDNVRSFVTVAKSIKNDVEIQGFRNCSLRDSVALVEFFGWLEKELVKKKKKNISEFAAAKKVLEFRKKQQYFRGVSYGTISSVGPNAAIIHYEPPESGGDLIDVKQLYLLDSGGQYLDGTTDVTRTLHFGTPTAFEKDCFTRVLKGHIQLDSAVFPNGTKGSSLDALARTALWQVGLDYRHGTGHGVGSYLNVHEGPQGIANKVIEEEVALQAGMTTSIEPGFYEDNKFGVRIENVAGVRKVELENNFGKVGFLGFEKFTMVPIQLKLVNKKLLTKFEIEWINNYHRECFKKVGPFLKKNSIGYSWLKKETKKL
ncbi:hypothetical protein HK099_006189 [Clydaea vesicula]|uniref:Uncharacterized protein n=1 Tax=Clydaea vesicula TaxID=447962 RepID=A0AAD5XYH5_9FUNG|nr:hypothetical protein HK099_006189 [Clydaea vesicula]